MPHVTHNRIYFNYQVNVLIRSCPAKTTPTENGSAISNSKQSEEENIAHTTSNDSNEKTMMSHAITHLDVEVKMEICNNSILSKYHCREARQTSKPQNSPLFGVELRKYNEFNRRDCAQININSCKNITQRLCLGAD